MQQRIQAVKRASVQSGDAGDASDALMGCLGNDDSVVTGTRGDRSKSRDKLPIIVYFIAHLLLYSLSLFVLPVSSCLARSAQLIVFILKQFFIIYSRGIMYL